MRYRRLGNSGIDVSVIGHGTWQMGGDMFGAIDETQAIKAIHASLDSGVNLIDTAAAYGHDGESETIVGRAVEGRRDKVIIATKVGVLRIHGQYIRCLNPAIMRIELENSLKRLKTDYIDLYQIHWPDKNSSTEDALKIMLEMKKEGKIRAIGVSNFSVEEIKTGVEIADIASVQPPLNMLNRVSIGNGIVPYCARNNIGVLSYGSLGGGILAGKADVLPADGKEQRAGFYPYYKEPMLSKCRKLLEFLGKIADGRGVSVAEVSINWVLAQPGVTTSLIGGGSPEKAARNAKAADWELTEDEIMSIESEYKRIMDSD